MSDNDVCIALKTSYTIPKRDGEYEEESKLQSLSSLTLHLEISTHFEIKEWSYSIWCRPQMQYETLRRRKLR